MSPCTRYPYTYPYPYAYTIFLGTVRSKVVYE